MGIRDFHLDQQAFFASAFPYWIIQQNILFRTATHAETIAIFQLLRGGTRSPFDTSHTSLQTTILSRYRDRVRDIELLLHNARLKTHLSCNRWTSTFGPSLLGVRVLSRIVL